jgi:hypothetical protein
MSISNTFFEGNIKEKIWDLYQEEARLIDDLNAFGTKVHKFNEPAFRALCVSQNYHDSEETYMKALIDVMIYRNQELKNIQSECSELMMFHNPWEMTFSVYNCWKRSFDAKDDTNNAANDISDETSIQRPFKKSRHN